MESDINIERRVVMEKDRASEGVKIRCKFCDLKDTCKKREKKEKYEMANIVTYCVLTPNGRKNKKS